MAANTITALIQACKELGLRYVSLDKNNFQIEITKNNQVYSFLPNRNPLNLAIHEQIANDKFYTYQLLKNTIAQPRTEMFLDPNVKELFQKYKEFKTQQEISTHINNKFTFPLVLKRNSGGGGNNVFKCANEQELRQSLATIYDKNARSYDHVAIVQEFITNIKEYRVIVIDNTIELVYLKDNSNGNFSGNLSPLHWNNSKAVINNQKELVERMSSFIAPMLATFPIRYAGLDIVLDQENNLWLIEINSTPSFDCLVRDNGILPVVKLYKRILEVM